ncbi:MAG: nucleotide exchange factor GrpE [bacterium]|nr:nucleotide exchange factor GrpE [bacterium]
MPIDESVDNNELEKVKKERDEYLDGWKRAKADFINYKKEELSRLEEIAKYSNEDLIKEIITVLDNFDLALSYATEKQPTPTSESEPRPGSVGVEKGIYMIRTQIEDILKRRGLKKINVRVGDLFDPNLSEAIVEVESEKPPETIIEIIEPGYKLNEKIIRPTRVKISKSK